MGTRHLQTVITKNGEVKIKQYGQWDGYPSGQGLDILQYLRDANLEFYQDELEKINEVTEEQLNVINELEDGSWQAAFPYLSRDCGSNIHYLIEAGEVKFVQKCENSDWCEGFYTINFQDNTFRSVYHGKEATFPLDSLPSDEEYLAVMEN